MTKSYTFLYSDYTCSGYSFLYAEYITIDTMFCIQITPAVIIVSSMQNISPMNTRFCLEITPAMVINSLCRIYDQ